ncbi:MAG TPA: TolC family protein [bacterium]|nr:TolC family protein [bacterium]
MRRFFQLRSLFFPAIAVLFSFVAAAPLKLDLREAMRLARQRGTQAVVADERVQQALSRLTQARSVFLPQIGGTASFQRRTINLNAMGINIPGQNPKVGPFNTSDARLSVTQSIFDAAAIQRLRALQAGRDISEAERRKAEQDAMALVGSFYLNARRGEDQVRLAQSLLRVAEKRLAVAREARRVGAGTDLDVLQLESGVADRREDLAAARTTALEQRLDLAAALGLPQDHAIAFAAGDPFPKMKIPSDDEITAAVSGHPDMEVAEQTVKERKREISVEKADFFPKISASADYGASGTSFGDSFGTYSVGGQASLPIFRGGLRSGRIKEAKAKARESEVQRDDVARRTEAKARTARENLKQTSLLLEAARSDQKEAEKRLNVSRDRSESGAGSDLEAVESEAGAAAARDRSREAEATALLARVELEHALGRLDALIDGKGNP